MELMEQTVKGWNEIIIDSSCEVYKFYKVADVIETKLHIDFTGKINKRDHLFWQFTIEETDLVLFFIPEEGVGLYASSQIAATEMELSILRMLATSLFVQLMNFDWIEYCKGKTIGTVSDTNGVILLDISNFNGAGISLEKQTTDGSYTVNFDLFGWLARSHVEVDKKAAEKFILQLKSAINSFFDLYDIPEYKRKENWQQKHDRILQDIADLKTTYERSDQYKTLATTVKEKNVWWKRYWEALIGKIGW